MCREYKEFECIKAMDDGYIKKLDAMIDHYAPILDKIVLQDGSVFTLHDFEHHCYGLYKNISSVILSNNIAFGVGEGKLLPRELFILNCAVLLHDIGMTKTFCKRNRHSKDSIEIIEEDYNNASSPLCEDKSGLNRNEIDALKWIVLAHSDVKDGTIADEQNGLKNPALTDCMPAKVGNIRGKLLAGILRIADELDVSTDRLGKMRIEEELKKISEKVNRLNVDYQSCDGQDKDHIEEEIGTFEQVKESYTHWLKLHYIKEIKLEKNGVAKLVVYDEQLENKYIDNEIAAVSELLWDVYSKIKAEIQAFREYIESDYNLSSIVALKDVELETKNPFLLDFMNNKDKHIETTLEDETEPQLIYPMLSEQIKQFIENRHLLHVGHYYVNDCWCARDWIDLNEIVENESVLGNVVAQMAHKIESLMNNQEYILLGVDFAGMIICSRIAYILNKPFSYVIPTAKNQHTSSFETNLIIDSNKKIVLITDVIVSYKAIKEIVNTYAKYAMEERLEYIFALLFRKEKGTTLIDYSTLVPWIEKTYVANASFFSELRSNEECERKGHETCYSCIKEYD